MSPYDICIKVYYPYRFKIVILSNIIKHSQSDLNVVHQFCEVINNLLAVYGILSQQYMLCVLCYNK